MLVVLHCGGSSSAASRGMKRVAILLAGIFLAAVTLLTPRVGLSGKKTWPVQPIAVNKATVEQLASLPGVGPVLAKRIVEFRVKHGPFRRLEDLLVIQGMSRKKFEFLKPHLRLD